MSILQVQHIEKHFGDTRVLEDISFELEQGQALAIIGSSGTRSSSTRETPPPSGRARSAKSGSTSAWCSSPSTCFPSTRR